MNRATPPSTTLDLAIIGGGPAGMAAALVAGRALLDTVVINSETPRNAVTRASHGYLTRDGVHPLELLRIAKEQLSPYDTVAYRRDTVAGIERSGANFVVTTEQHTVFEAERILFATGSQEDVAGVGIAGLVDVYGTSVFPCPFCDGWEQRRKPLALFGAGAWGAAFAKTVAHWSSDLILFTHGDATLSATDASALARNGVRVETNRIAFLDHVEGVLTAVVLEDGRRIERRAGFVFDTGEEPATSLPETLGVPRSEDGSYQADAVGRTRVDGVYVVGDSRTGFGGLMAAAAEGSGAAEMIVHDIIDARWA
jgi:thioredoxin reductase